MGHHWHGGAWGAGPWGSPPPWAEFMRGFGGFRDPRSRGGPKVRRGDVRLAIIDVLAAEPLNGYQVIQEIARRSGGEWKPSPGSVYPTLQQLQDEGLIRERGEGGSRRRFELTDEGHAYVEEHLSELAETWRAFEEPEGGIDSNDLRPVIGQVMGACWQVACTGTMPQQEKAFEILSETKTKLYRLLAEGGA
ncbi:MAG: PadR family transcriptional regulator [Nocardioidaceae bacterium]